MDILQNNKLGANLSGRLGLDYFFNILLLLYIFTMPFVSAFAFTGTISLPLIFAMFLFMNMGLKIILFGKSPDGFLGIDLVIISFFLFLVLLSFANNGWGNSKSLNHTVAYIATFLLFYVTIKFTLFKLPDKNRVFRNVLQFISYATLISAVYANLEFISSNFFDIDLNEYIPRVIEGEKLYNPLVIGLYTRARGFAAESGHFTFMMELLSPPTIYYIYFSTFCKWHSSQKAIVIIIIVFSFIFAASSASFIIVPLAVLIAALVHIKRIFFYLKTHPVKFLIASGIASFIFLVFNYFLSIYTLILLSVGDKLESGSFDDRKERIDFFYDKFFRLDSIKSIIGVGPAGFDVLGYDASKSILSLYYSLTFELGYLGLFLILLLFFYILVNTLKIKTKIGFFLLVSVISGVIHYNFIANFWFPWFWFIGAFAIFCKKNFLIDKRYSTEYADS